MARITLLFFFLLSVSNTFAQTEEATTTNGKKVILYADGTWKYKDEKKTEPVKPADKKEAEKKKPEENIAVVTMSGSCAEKLETTQDKNNVLIKRTKNFIIVADQGGKQEIDISMQKGAKGVINVSFRAIGGGDCIGEGNRINIIFTDGSKMDLFNDGPQNCRGESIANFNGPFGKKKQLQELTVKRIASVKVWTQQSSVKQDLSKENQEEFAQVLSCLISQ